MRISFVYPPFNMIAEGYSSSAKNKGMGNWIPFGLGVLASCVIEQGHKAEIIDAAVNGYSSKEVVDRIKDFGADIVGISCQLASKDHSIELIRFIKKNIPGINVVVGGPYATSFPEELFKEFNDLDFVLMGETEKTLPELMSKLENGEPVAEIKGLAYRRKGKIKRNNLPEPIMNLDDRPAPAWELFDIRKYIPLPLMYRKLPIVTYVTSRGCPYRRCAYCYQSGGGGPVYRRHSPEYVVKDIKRLVNEFGVKEIGFWDDNFLFNENWVLRFCELLKKEKLNISWQAYGHCRFVTEKMLKSAAETGCWNVFYGIESGNQDLLDNINKGVTLERIKEVIEWTHKYGMDSRGSFILALPGENPKKAMKTIKFAIDLDLTFAQFLPLFPEHGTKIYEEAMRGGKIIRDYSGGRMGAHYAPKGYKNVEEVQKMVKMAHRKFYFRPMYFVKHLRKLIRQPSLIRQYYDGLRIVIGWT